MQTRHFDRRSEYPLRVNYLQPSSNYFRFYSALRSRSAHVDAEVYKTRLAAGVPIAQIHLEEWQGLGSSGIERIKEMFYNIFYPAESRHERFRGTSIPVEGEMCGFPAAVAQYRQETGWLYSIKELLKHVGLVEICQLNRRYFATH